MTPNDFYQQYGQHIYQAQRGGNSPNWPYIRPITNWPNNIVNLSQLHIPDNNNNNINRFTYLGFDYHDSNISVVLEGSGKITSKSILRNSVAVSYDFSGCYMAKFCFRENWFICHIYCIGANQSSDCRISWNSFINTYYHNGNDISNVILFKPTRNGYGINYLREVNRFPPNQIKIAGLITPNNTYYSLPIDRENAFVIDSPVQIQRIWDGLIR